MATIDELRKKYGGQTESNDSDKNEPNPYSPITMLREKFGGKSETKKASSIDELREKFKDRQISQPNYWYPGMPEQERQETVGSQVEPTPERVSTNDEPYQTWYPGMPQQERTKALDTDETKRGYQAQSEYERKAEEIQKQMDEIVPRREFLGIKTSYFPQDTKDLTKEESRKLYELGMEKAEYERLARAGFMGTVEGFVPLDVEARQKKSYELLRGTSEGYQGEELQQLQAYKTGRVVGQVAEFATFYGLAGGTVEKLSSVAAEKIGLKKLSTSLANKISSSAGKYMVNEILPKASTELVKDVFIGGSLNLQEARERGLEGEELRQYMTGQFGWDLLFNAGFLAGGEIIRGAKSYVANAKDAQKTFEVVADEMKRQGFSAKEISDVKKNVFDANVTISENALPKSFKRKYNSINATREIIDNFDNAINKTNQIDTSRISFNPLKAMDDIPVDNGVRIGDDVFNVVSVKEGTYVLENKNALQFELPKDAINSVGEVTNKIEIPQSTRNLSNIKTRAEALELKNSVSENIYDLLEDRALRTESLSVSEDTFKSLKNTTEANYKEAIIASKKQLSTLEKSFKNDVKKELKAVVDKSSDMLPEYRDAIKNIVDDIDLTDMTSKKKLRLESLKKYINNAEETYDYYQVPEDLLAAIDDLNGRRISELTSDELNTVLQSVKHLEHIEKTKNTVLSNIKNKNLDELREGVISFDTKKGVQEKIPSRFKDNEIYKKVKWTESKLNYFFKTGAINLDRTFKMIGNWSDETPIHNLYKQLEEGFSNKQQLHTKEYIQTNEDLLKRLDLNAVGKQIDTDMFSSQEVKTLYNNLSTMEKVEIYLNTKNSYNYKNLVSAEGGIKHRNLNEVVQLNDNDVKMIVDSLSDNQKQYGDFLFDFNNSKSKQRVNATSVVLDGREIAVEPNYHYVMPYKTPTVGAKAGRSSLEAQQYFRQRTSKPTSIMLFGAEENFKRYNDAVANYYGLAVPVRDMKAVINDAKVQQSLTNRFGENIITTLNKKIADLEGGMRLGMTPDIATSKKVIRNIQTAILGANPKIMFNQLASVPTAMSEINPIYFLGKQGDISIINKYSPELWNRFRGMITRESAEALQKGSVSSTALIRFGDTQAIKTIWGAVEREVASNTGMSALKNGDEFYQAVAKRVEEVVHKTQPNYHTLFTSAIGSTDSTFMRLATMFSTQRNQNYQILMEGIASGDATKAAKSIGAVSVASLTIAGINKGASLYRETDYDLGKGFASSMTSNAYFAGFVSNRLLEGYDADNIVESTINEMMDGFDMIAEGNTKQGYKKMFSGMATITGKPIKNIEREFRYGLQKFKPELHYEYNKIFGEPSRTTLYENFADALKDGETDFIRTLVKDMAEDGVEYSNLKRSMGSKDIDEDSYSIFKKYLDNYQGGQ